MSFVRIYVSFAHSKEILKEAPSLDDGIGLPDIKLCLCLAFSWICITLIVSKGKMQSHLAINFVTYN